ncbi:MAG: DUF2807 domain-containing protein [Candidatus Symbiothrix sp.]|jgi:hypothetical protein|nr:DUF2807 domain-containing protein [Candidatus Symbiothrix sp.]
MKRFTPVFIFVFALFSLLNTSCVLNDKTIKGNYNIVNQTLSIDDYESIELRVGAELIYRQSPQSEPFLQVAVDENILPSLRFLSKGKRLIIDQKNDSNLNPTRFVIYTNSKSLNDIKIAGSGDICLENEVNAPQMDIEITGSGDVKADSLFCENIRLQITGSGDISIAWAATTAGFSITGSGDINALDFLAGELKCQITGSGDIKAFAGNELNVSITGSGDMHYRGNPDKINLSVNGSGDIKKVEE